MLWIIKQTLQSKSVSSTEGIHTPCLKPIGPCFQRFNRFVLPDINDTSIVNGFIPFLWLPLAFILLLKNALVFYLSCLNDTLFLGTLEGKIVKTMYNQLFMCRKSTSEEKIYILSNQLILGSHGDNPAKNHSLKHEETTATSNEFIEFKMSYNFCHRSLF